MKIVIPSSDNQKISKHFGKSKGFTIIEVEGREIISREHKENNFTTHAKEGNKHSHEALHYAPEHKHEHHHDHHGQHNHDDIFKTIGDCQVVIGGGMGRHLYKDFEAKGTKVYITQETSIDKALELFFEDKLDNNTDKCCNH